MKNYTTVSLAALAAMASLASCSEQEMSSTIKDDGAIRFAANTDFGSRADVTTSNLSEFNVYAYTGAGATQNVFMDNVKVTKSASNVWTYSPLKYWPSTAVDFYAFAPSTWGIDAGTLEPVAYDNHVGKTDLVYAVAAGLTGNGEGANAQVVFNFRHALSKVTVLLSSTDENLKVNVTNVALANVKAKGDFTFPKQTTSGTPAAQTTGTWSNLADSYTYLLHMSQSQDDVVTLTTTPTDLSETGLGGPKYLIPQTLNWRSQGAGGDNYIGIMCSVYDAKTGVKLWPNANTPEEDYVEGSTNKDGILKFQLSTSQFSAWSPGYHYVYNLVVNANSEMGTIEFGTPTVDSYIDVETTYN